MLEQAIEKQERTFKVLVIGDIGTGKTSLIRRYVSQLFSIHYKATIGSDFALKVLDWGDELQVKLQLWDIAGQERFGTMTRVYYRDAVGAFVVFDVTRAATFEAIEKWKNDLDSKALLPNGYLIPTVLLANKCDQESLFKKDKITKMCSDKGFVKWFETSAKENIGIDEAVTFLVTKILEAKKEGFQRTIDKDIVSPVDPHLESTRCCSWRKNPSPPLQDPGQQN